MTELTDSIGSTTKAYAYDAWGNIVQQTGTVENPYTYTGREVDPETGLYYYRARYYDSTTGRFLQKDPLGFDNGSNTLNLYVYSNDNPLRYTDPRGLYIIQQPQSPRKPALRPDYGAPMDIFLLCLDTCYGSQVIVTSTHEDIEEHELGTPHRNGQAVDIKIPSDQNKMNCCAAQCGAKWGHVGSPKNPHLHYQLVPGILGGSVDKGTGGIVTAAPSCGCS